MKALVLDLFEVAALECQEDTMWSMNPRDKGISTLAKHKVVEAMPVALAMLVTPTGFGWGDDQFKVPALKGHLLTCDPASTEYATLNATISSISSAATSPSGLTNLFPVANSQVVTTTNAKAITLSGFSCRISNVTFMNVTAPAHGSLSGTAPNLTYTPTANYSGLDKFTFEVRVEKRQRLGSGGFSVKGATPPTP